MEILKRIVSSLGRSVSLRTHAVRIRVRKNSFGVCARAWMRLSPYARAPEWTLLWFGHGCAGHRLRSGMDVVMVWAWMLS